MRDIELSSRKKTLLDIWILCSGLIQLRTATDNNSEDKKYDDRFHKLIKSCNLQEA